MSLSKRKSLSVLLICLGLVTLLLACAPRMADPEATDASMENATEQQLLVPAWSPASDCASCHVNEAVSQSDPKSLASLHSEQKCGSCHSDETSLTEVHEDYAAGELPTKLKLSTVTDAEGGCLSSGCHNQEELATKTAASLVLTDNEGTRVNPHALPATAQHLAEGIACVDCHMMHQDYDLEKEARETCTNCHHQNVYQCGTCHTV
jgi:hypothetical protein